MKHTSLFLFVLIIISIICEANSFERTEIISAQGGGVAQLIAQQGGAVEQIAQDIAEAEQSPHLNLQGLVFNYYVIEGGRKEKTILISFLVGIFTGVIATGISIASAKGTSIILYHAYYWFYEND